MQLFIYVITRQIVVDTEVSLRNDLSIYRRSHQGYTVVMEAYSNRYRVSVGGKVGWLYRSVRDITVRVLRSIQCSRGVVGLAGDTVTTIDCNYRSRRTHRAHYRRPTSPNRLSCAKFLRRWLTTSALLRFRSCRQMGCKLSIGQGYGIEQLSIIIVIIYSP